MAIWRNPSPPPKKKKTNKQTNKTEIFEKKHTIWEPNYFPAFLQLQWNIVEVNVI